jgi:hypothetical protein
MLFLTLLDSPVPVHCLPRTSELNMTERNALALRTHLTPCYSNFYYIYQSLLVACIFRRRTYLFHCYPSSFIPASRLCERVLDLRRHQKIPNPPPFLNIFGPNSRLTSTKHPQTHVSIWNNSAQYSEYGAPKRVPFRMTSRIQESIVQVIRTVLRNPPRENAPQMVSIGAILKLPPSHIRSRSEMTDEHPMNGH